MQSLVLKLFWVLVCCAIQSFKTNHSCLKVALFLFWSAAMCTFGLNVTPPPGGINRANKKSAACAFFTSSFYFDLHFGPTPSRKEGVGARECAHCKLFIDKAWPNINMRLLQGANMLPLSCFCLIPAENLIAMCVWRETRMSKFSSLIACCEWKHSLCHKNWNTT